MKHIFMALWLVCLVLGAIAQEKTLTIKKVKEGEEPKEVQKAIKKDFPNAVTRNFSYLPSELYGEEWNIKVEEVGDLKTDFYQIDISTQNEHYTAVYNVKGVLLSSKQVIDDVTLPVEVRDAVKKFKGWHIDKTQEVITCSHASASKYYKVKLQDGLKHKYVFIDPVGNILKERITMDLF